MKTGEAYTSGDRALEIQSEKISPKNNQLSKFLNLSTNLHNNAALMEILEKNLAYVDKPKTTEEALERLNDFASLMQECIKNKEYKLARVAFSFIFTNQDFPKDSIKDLSKHLAAEGNLTRSKAGKQYLKKLISTTAINQYADFSDRATNQYILTSQSLGLFFDRILTSYQTFKHREYKDTYEEFYGHMLGLFALSQIETDAFPPEFQSIQSQIPHIAFVPITKIGDNHQDQNLDFLPKGKTIFELPQEIAKRLSKVKLINTKFPYNQEIVHPSVKEATNILDEFKENPEIKSLPGLVNAITKLLKQAEQKGSPPRLPQATYLSILELLTSNLEITFLVLAKLKGNTYTEAQTQQVNSAPPKTKNRHSQLYITEALKILTKPGSIKTQKQAYGVQNFLIRLFLQDTSNRPPSDTSQQKPFSDQYTLEVFRMLFDEEENITNSQQINGMVNLIVKFLRTLSEEDVYSKNHSAEILLIIGYILNKNEQLANKVSEQLSNLN